MGYFIREILYLPFDGGLSCEDNLKALRDAGFDYLVAVRRQQRDREEEVVSDH